MREHVRTIHHKEGNKRKRVKETDGDENESLDEEFEEGRAKLKRRG
jgi:hypothetical protein